MPRKNAPEFYYDSKTGYYIKKVKDPNLVGKLSGHKEGSRAFARYRDIDDEMISDLTNLL